MLSIFIGSIYLMYTTHAEAIYLGGRWQIKLFFLVEDIGDFAGDVYIQLILFLPTAYW